MTDSERVEACAAQLLAACRDADLFVTGDLRISEMDAAALLGYSSGHLKNLRAEGSGPVAYRVAINGNRVSYALRDLAIWIESRRENW